MIPILCQILMDRESLICYENNREVVWNDVLRRLKLQERKTDRCKPDYFYTGASSVSMEGINSLSELLSVGICRLGNHYLELKGQRVFIRLDKFVNWQQICCQLTPLLLQSGTLYKLLPTNLTAETLQHFAQTTLKENLYFTAIPSPEIPELNFLVEKEGGLHDLHIHLNGATETDLLWQYILSNPFLTVKDFDSNLKKQSPAKEQAEQEEVNFSGKLYLNRILTAIKIRRQLVASLAERAELPIRRGHPIYFCLDVNPSKADPNLILVAEALFYLLVMRALETSKDERFANLFHQYLLTLGMVNRFVVQQVYQFGFDQFQKITVNNFREDYEKHYTKRFYQWSGPRLNHLSFLEGRFSPKDTPAKNRKILTDIIAGWENFIKGHEYYHREQKSENKSTPQLRLVAHFIKTADRKYSKHGDWETVVRWKQLRVELTNKAMALIVVKKHPKFGQYLTGIDAASNEMATPPEVFAPVFRLLKSKGFHITFHAGEDFRHILSGLRSMYEAFTFLQLTSGDRLGHGTAAGISPQLWIERMGSCVYISQGEWLDNLIFCRYLLTNNEKDTEKGILELIPKIESCISDMCALVYEEPFSYYALTEAWLLRQYEPEIILAPDKLNEWNMVMRKYTDSEIGKIRKSLMHKEVRELTKIYHRKSIRVHYDKMITVSIEDPISCEGIIYIQQNILKILQSKNIVIESLPTSNLRISFYHHLNEHHIERWVNPVEKSKRPSVVLGTDDTGIFCTNIYNEYAHVYQKLLDMGYTSYSAMDIMRQLNDMGKIYRFDKP